MNRIEVNVSTGIVSTIALTEKEIEAAQVSTAAERQQREAAVSEGSRIEKRMAALEAILVKAADASDAPQEVKDYIATKGVLVKER